MVWIRSRVVIIFHLVDERKDGFFAFEFLLIWGTSKINTPLSVEEEQK